MEFLNNPENRDIRKIIDNYVNNINLKFNNEESPYISLKYYISETSTFEFNLNIWAFVVKCEDKKDDYHYLKIKVLLDSEYQYNYQLKLTLEKESFLFVYKPYRHRNCHTQGSMTLKIDYPANKEEIDKLMKFIISQNF